MKLTESAISEMMRYTWPGNVRELRNALELAVCVAQNEDVIDVDHLPVHIRASKAATQSEEDPQDLHMKAEIRTNEIQLIRNALGSCRGNKARAAKRLGISRSSLYNKLKRYAIQTG